MGRRTSLETARTEKPIDIKDSRQSYSSREAYLYLHFIEAAIYTVQCQLVQVPAIIPRLLGRVVLTVQARAVFCISDCPMTLPGRALQSSRNE